MTWVRDDVGNRGSCLVTHYFGLPLSSWSPLGKLSSRTSPGTAIQKLPTTSGPDCLTDPETVHALHLESDWNSSGRLAESSTTCDNVDLALAHTLNVRIAGSLLFTSRNVKKFQVLEPCCQSVATKRPALPPAICCERTDRGRPSGRQIPPSAECKRPFSICAIGDGLFAAWVDGKYVGEAGYFEDFIDMVI